jgi:3-oxoacyl-[acyl-carrier protein] reductase
MSSTEPVLKGKVAIVTGASRGIGQEIALLFAEKGAKLVLTARNFESLEALSKKIVLLGAEQPLIFSADVKDSAKITEVVDKTLDKWKRVDILVNNAGVTKDALFVRMAEADWEEVLDTNLKGTFLFMKAVCRVMMKQRSGSIVNMASVIGLTGNAGQANYAASKAGIIALTKSVAKELGSRNVRVNAIAPGFIETEMTDALAEEVKKAILKAVPVGHFGRPMDVALAALYLASDNSRFVTGQVITVDGGMVMV